MINGHFYYLTDQYFIDFPDTFLMQNKETINGQAHDRPCFYAFKDETTGIYWMIPFSSQTSKYQRIYDAKIQKYKRCDTILFGDVLGHKKAFLIQNMCPIIDEYVKKNILIQRPTFLLESMEPLNKFSLLKQRKFLLFKGMGLN